jgi:hypothetical protein
MVMMAMMAMDRAGHFQLTLTEAPAIVKQKHLLHAAIQVASAALILTG